MSEQFNLPEDFDFEQEVINFQFAMMIKMRYHLEKRLQVEEQRLREHLKEHFSDIGMVDKIINKVQLTAYRRIPGEFWQTFKTK